MDEAIAPESFSVTPPKPKQTTTNEIEAEERQLAQLTTYPGWQIFERDYMAEVQSLREMRGTVLKGKSTAEVGEMYLIAREAADRMESQLARIKAIAEAVHGQ